MYDLVINGTECRYQNTGVINVSLGYGIGEDLCQNSIVTICRKLVAAIVAIAHFPMYLCPTVVLFSYWGERRILCLMIHCTGMSIALNSVLF